VSFVKKALFAGFAGSVPKKSAFFSCGMKRNPPYMAKKPQENEN
jgi:hypothetical protein